MAELMAMVDEHLEWTTQKDRPTSSDTLIVDWDGSGEPIISYRKKVEESLVPAPPAPRTLAPSRGPSQTFPTRTPSQARAPTSSRIPVQGQQDPPVYKRKPLPAVPSVGESMRQLRQPERVQHKPYTTQHPERYDSVISQARGQQASKPLPPPPALRSSQSSQPQHSPNKYITTDGFFAIYRPPRFSTSLNAQRPAYIRGYDQWTEYEYDYDGSVVHVRRSSPSKWSEHSDYYAVHVEEYARNGSLEVVVPETKEEQKKHGSVVRFVEKVLLKLDGLGLMKKLRDERKANKKGESWKKEGYLT